MYDLIIIGAGPAGLTASIYASCFGLKNLLIGKTLGGQMLLAPDILNYPGFEEITGSELSIKMINQAKKRGGELITDEIVEIKKVENGFNIKTSSNKEFQAKTIILATGVERKKLNVRGEVEYTAKGIQYCATCGRFDYMNTIAAVIGGANAAAQTAAQVAHSASKVYIIYRGNELRCDPVWKEHLKTHPNVEIIYNAIVTEIIGNGQKLTGVKMQIKNPETQTTETKEMNLDRLFIEIGGVPGTALLIPLGVQVDTGGYIAVDEKLATVVPGIFAAGDVISHKYSIEQISSAVGSGARATTSAFSFLKQQNAPSLWGKSQIKR